MKDRAMNIIITYHSGNNSQINSTHTKIESSFSSLINGFSKAKKDKAFVQFKDFAINPDYIITIKIVNEG